MIGLLCLLQGQRRGVYADALGRADLNIHHGQGGAGISRSRQVPHALEGQC